MKRQRHGHVPPKPPERSTKPVQGPPIPHPHATPPPVRCGALSGRCSCSPPLTDRPRLSTTPPPPRRCRAHVRPQARRTCSPGHMAQRDPHGRRPPPPPPVYHPRPPQARPVRFLIAGGAASHRLSGLQTPQRRGPAYAPPRDFGLEPATSGSGVLCSDHCAT